MTKTWVILNDIQIPFEDKKSLGAAVKFIQELKPYGVILNGDIVDCYPISDFAKDPINNHTIGLEVAGASKLMGAIRPYCSDATWIGGNHEDRWRRFLWKNAPELARVESLAFPKVFNIELNGFRWLPYGEHINLGKLMVTHGSMVSQHSAYTARKHLERYGTSVIIGHTHRMGTFYNTNMRGVHVAYENGCLCKLTPEYVKHPNWQQGFSVVHVDDGRSGFFSVQQIPILPGRRFYYGQTLVRF